MISIEQEPGERAQGAGANVVLGVEGVGAGLEFSQVGEAVAVRVFGGIGGIEWIETVGDLEAVGHAVIVVVDVAGIALPGSVRVPRAILQTLDGPRPVVSEHLRLPAR